MCVIANIIPVLGAELELNPDTLRKANKDDDYYYQDIKADEIFIGLGNGNFTVNEVYECMKKYGLNMKKDADEVSRVICVENLKIGFYWENWDNTLYDVHEDDIPIPHDSLCEIWFSSSVYNPDTQTFTEYSAADRDALIERVEYINNGGKIAAPEQKNGWSFEEGVWRFYDNSARVTGWKKIDECWYYFKSDTSMIHSGFETIDGLIYHFSSSGVMDIGWQFLDRNGTNCWYYFDVDGRMVIGWKEIEGHWYYFQGDGTLTHSKLETMEDGKQYYFNTDGWMLSDTNIIIEGINYIIDSSGVVSVPNTKFAQKVQEVLALYQPDSYWFGSGQCHGFARELQKKIFGSDRYVDSCAPGCREDHGNHNWNSAKTTDIKEGDLVRISGHSFFVIAIEQREDGTFLKTREVWGNSGNIIKDNEWKIVSETELQGAPGIWNQTLQLQYIRRVIQ